MIHKKTIFKIVAIALLILQLAKYLFTPIRIPGNNGDEIPVLAYIGYMIGYNIFLLFALVFLKKGFSYRRQS
jgi:hypothetical protein